MRQSSLAAAIGVAAMTLMLGGCGVGSSQPMMLGTHVRLGPPAAQVQLYYEDFGKGPPVLLIHGFGTSTYTWRYIAPELARNHRVISVDLKGFGQSDKPFDERYSVFDQAELVAQLIEDLDLRDLTLIGHSYGGGIALLLALEADQQLQGRITKLALLDTIAYPQNIPVFFQMLSTPLLSHLGVRMVPPSAQVRVALQIAYFDNDKIDDSEVEVYAAPLKTAAGKHAIIHSARQIIPADIDQLSERYQSIELPTLIVWCDHDRIVPLDVGLKLRRTLPNSTLRIIDQCGHMPQEEQPARTLDLLQGFLGGKLASR